jgi:hypothetical protein
MALTKQTVAFPIGSEGQDSGTNPQIQATKPTRISNGEHDSVNGLIKKRSGTTKRLQLGESNLASYKDQLINYGNTLTKISSDDDTWSTGADLNLSNVSDRSIPVYLSKAYFYSDICYSADGTWYAVIYRERTGMYLVVETFDTETNTRQLSLSSVLPIAATGDYYLPPGRMVAIGTSIFIYTINNNWKISVIELSDSSTIGSPTEISMANIVSSLYPAIEVTYIPYTAAPYVVIAYISGTGSSRNVFRLHLPNGVAAGAQTYSSLTSESYKAVDVIPVDDIGGGYYTLAGYDSAGTGTLIGAVCDESGEFSFSDVATLATWDATKYHCYQLASCLKTNNHATALFTLVDLQTYLNVIPAIPSIFEVDFSNSGDTITAETATKTATMYQLLSKPKYSSDLTSIIYAAYFRTWKPSYTSDEEVAQHGVYWMSLDTNGNSVVVGKHLAGSARQGVYAGSYTKGNPPCSNIVTDNTYKTLCWEILRDSPDQSLYGTHQIQELELTIPYSGEHTVVETPHHLSIPGGCPVLLDGEFLIEESLLTYPEYVVASGLNGAGSMAAGTYRYKQVNEFTDINGLLHRSTPTGTPAELTIVAPQDTAYVTLFDVHDVERSASTLPGAIQTVTYRTLVNGTEYYRLPNTSSVTVPGYLTDVYSDDDISENETLYTDIGELEATVTPAYTISCMHQGRKFIVAASTGLIWYSKELSQSNLIAPEYNELLTIECPFAGGDITALASLLDHLVIFKERAIYISDGEGLSISGTGVNYRTPFLINQGIGCNNPQTVVSIPQGVIFASDNNIWLLGPDMQLKPIGDEMAYYLSNYTLLSATVVSAENKVLFHTTSTISLVFNYVDNKWTTFVWPTSSIAAVKQNNKLNRLDTSRYLWTDDSTSFADNTAAIPLTIDTGWMPFAGIGGFQRVYKIGLLGYTKGSHVLQVKIAYDYDAYWVDTVTANPTSLTAFGVDAFFGAGSSSYANQAMMLEVCGSRTKCTAIRLEITETQVTPADSYQLAAVYFSVGIKPGSNRPTSNRRLS